MESSNDVIIQNLVVPSTILTSSNQNDGINLNLQHQELALTRTVASGVITETRSSGIINNTNCITSCQNPMKTTHVPQVFEESAASIEQTNAKVKYSRCKMLRRLSIATV